MSALDDLTTLPGNKTVGWRRERGMIVAAALLAMAWPPLVLTLIVWPPAHWVVGRETDWRLVVMLIGLIATPSGMALLSRDRERTGKPATRLGVIWRFVLYGGVLAAGLQVLYALVMTVLSAIGAGDMAQALGAVETVLLIYGVGGLPIAVLVGVSYALWAGICVAFLAFHHTPEVATDRLGLIDRPVRH